MPILAAMAAAAAANSTAATSAAAAGTNGTAAATNGAAGAAGGQGAGGAAGGATTLSDPELMYDTSLFLLAGAAIFILVLLPRAFVRFSHKSEWVEGHLLRSIQLGGITRRSAPVSSSKIEEPTYGHGNSHKERWNSSNDDTTYASHTNLVRKPLSEGDAELRRQTSPTHMPGVSTIFPKLATILRYPTLFPGVSIGKFIILVSYAVIIVYAGIFQTNPLSDPKREGYLAAMQIPPVILFATKNNVLGMLIGFGYERLNYIHRFAGRMMILAADVHAVGWIYQFVQAGEFGDMLAEPFIQWGIVAVICCNVLFLLSTGIVRSKLYNSLFIPSHIVSAVLMCVAACFHEPFCIPYVLIATSLYGLDRIMRLAKTRITTASLRPLPDLGLTRIEVPGINAGWRAGQHVRLKVLSTGMGILGWAESHPFTIASVSRSPSGEGLVLMVKKAGDWTNRLYNLAQRVDYGEANGLGGKVRVAVQGPYGGPGHAMFASFSGAMFVAGGSGITFALSAVQELMKQDLEARSRVRAIELVWTIQDPAALTPLVPLFSSLVAQAQGMYASLHISVFYTRAPANAEALRTFRHLPPGLTLSPARPKLGNILKGVVDNTVSSFQKDSGLPLTGVIVGVCGPAGLGADMRRAVSACDADSRKQVGGVELHEEAFGW